MQNSEITIGIDLIEGALRRQPGVQVEKLELVPPNVLKLTAGIGVSMGGTAILLHPETAIQLVVANRRIDFQVVSLNVLGLPVPTVLVQTKLDEFLHAPESEANALIQEVTARTEFVLAGLSVSEDRLILSFSRS